jgi:hypothetical protein
VSDHQDDLRSARKRAFEARVAAIERVHAGERRAGSPSWRTRRDLWKDPEGNVLARLPDGTSRYVMVQFERPLMEKTAEILCRGGGHVLNVGFGCGLVDEAIAKRSPRSHTIVEAHPQVLEWMAEDGWMHRPNVHVLADCWEDVDWTRFRHRFDAVFEDVFPFDTTSIDLDLWLEVVRLVLKPESGVFVLYGPNLSEAHVDRMFAAFRGQVSVHWESCQVHVPFVIPEWERFTVGTHTVWIPWVTIRV